MNLVRCELCEKEFEEQQMIPITVLEESLIVCWECEGLIRMQRHHRERQMTEIEQLTWDQLTIDERVDFSEHYSKYANFIKIVWPNGDKEIISDGGEPEDQTFGRDLNWIVPALKRMRDGWQITVRDKIQLIQTKIVELEDVLNEIGILTYSNSETQELLAKANQILSDIWWEL